MKLSDTETKNPTTQTNEQKKTHMFSHFPFKTVFYLHGYEQSYLQNKMKLSCIKVTQMTELTQA